MKLRIHPEAEQEVTEVAEWYDERDPNLTHRFLLELEKTSQQIQSTPKIFQPLGRGYRRVQLARFPFFIIYIETSDEIQIHAVAHAKRRAGYWRGRSF